MPDYWAFLRHWIRDRGAEEPLHSLGFDFTFGLPGVGTLARRLGAVPANHTNGARLLEQDGSVMVYPGGDEDNYRPWTERHRVDLHGRTGFVRLALRQQVPVVPLVAHGSPDAIFVLSRGDALRAGSGCTGCASTSSRCSPGHPGVSRPCRSYLPVAGQGHRSGLPSARLEPLRPRRGRRPGHRPALLRGDPRASPGQPRRAGRRRAAPPARPPRVDGARSGRIARRNGPLRRRPSAAEARVDSSPTPPTHDRVPGSTGPPTEVVQVCRARFDWRVSARCDGRPRLCRPELLGCVLIGGRAVAELADRVASPRPTACRRCAGPR